MRTKLIVGVAFAAGAVPTLALNGMLLFGAGPWATPGSEFLLAPGFAALPLAALGAVLIPFRRTRRAGMVVASAAAALFLGTIIGTVAAGRLRMWSFQLAANRARPLVEALARYQTDTKRPPASFSDVVPRYLPTMPGRLPPLELVSGADAEARYLGNPWVLRADVGTGLLNWDEFLYFPHQNYPTAGYGGSLERVGDWAYVHE